MPSNLVASANRFLSVFNAQSNTETQASSPEAIRELIARDQDAVAGGGAGLTVAAVFACVGLLADTIASLPMGLYKRKGDKHVLDVSHPVHQLLAVCPNETQTPFEFVRLMIVCLLLRGNFYGLKNVLGDRITGITPLNPDSTRPRVNKKGLLEYVTTLNGVEKVYSQADILHVRGLSTDGLTGISVFQAARRTIGMALQMEKHGNSVFANGASPSGVLQSDKPLSEEAYARLRADFEANYTGAANAHKTMILEDGLKWEQLSMTMEDAQWIESRKFARSEIAMFFRMPPQLIGDIERGTSWGSGLEQQNLGFLVYTVLPYLTNIRQACVRDLLPREQRTKFVVKFDTAILTQADFADRQNGLQIQIRNGVISQNDWRKIEGYDPIDDPEADEYSRDSNSAPAAPRPGNPAKPGEDDADED